MVAGAPLRHCEWRRRRPPANHRANERRAANMRNTMMVLGAVAFGSAGAGANASTGTGPTAERTAEPTAKKTSRLFLDEHVLGPGQVTVEAVAAAHARDLATQG